MELTLKHTKVFAKTLDAFGQGYRVIVNQGGTRSSKTYSLAQLFLYLALKEKGKTFSVVRKTLPSLKATAYRDFFDILKTSNLYNEAWHNKTELTYNLNGNLIEFFSVDNEQKVRGRKRDYLWINESNEVSQEDFQQLIFRTSDKIFLDYNPSIAENHWIVTDVLTRDDVKLIISTYKDNPFLSSTQIKEIERLKTLNPTLWAIYGLGERADIQTGTVFLKDFYSEYDYLPKDIKSVIYCDPNLSIKGKGDTTAVTHLGYSAKEDKYYVIDAIAHSFSDPNELLFAVAKMKLPQTVGIAFDGNVHQESTWTNFVKNWAKEHDSPFYRIEYKRYKVDDLSKNIQLTWNEKRILFPPGFSESLSGKIYLSQLFAFTSKKAKIKDDAPDSLICAFEYLHERRIPGSKTEVFQQPVIKEILDF